MSDDPKKRAHDLKELADEALEFLNEDPEMEPGQADTTPAVPAQGTSHAAKIPTDSPEAQEELMSDKSFRIGPDPPTRI